MPSDKHNSITVKATGLIFSLFKVTLAREVLFGILQYVQYILSVLLCGPVELVVPRDGFFSKRKLSIFFHSGYFDCRGVFRTVLDS